MKLNKELIESTISTKYINAKNFKWDVDCSVDFDFDRIVDQDYLCDNEQLKQMLAQQQNYIVKLEGKLEQSDTSFKTILKEFFNERN